MFLKLCQRRSAYGRPVFGVRIAFRKDRVLDWLAGAVRFAFSERLGFVEALDEQHVGELFHHLKRIRDTA